LPTSNANQRERDSVAPIRANCGTFVRLAAGKATIENRVCLPELSREKKGRAFRAEGLGRIEYTARKRNP
jgi:hypothetical protein